ncbi:unnamed protein product [Albugo candida]|uniref:Uncharacterized protein n=1 Tax=Albugo candida TaxID=65357 RepID=A0A024GM68_9STRA|nr:unnamed protein product [Albugo candida]|eukprot:CCI47407.1 unnamed protein product [Albugo candida]
METTCDESEAATAFKNMDAINVQRDLTHEKRSMHWDVNRICGLSVSGLEHVRRIWINLISHTGLETIPIFSDTCCPKHRFRYVVRRDVALRLCDMTGVIHKLLPHRAPHIELNGHTESLVDLSL